MNVLNSKPSSNIERCLLEFKTLPSEKLPLFAKSISLNSELLDEFFYLFNYKEIDDEQIGTVCSQLFLFQRSDYKELQIFSLQFIPILILRYFLSLSVECKKIFGVIESFLLSTYNLIINRNRDSLNTNCKEIIVPSLYISSVYHESPNFDILRLPESNINRYSSISDVINPTITNQLDFISSTNRSLILTTLIREYNACISEMSISSRLSMCQLCNRLSNLNPRYPRLLFDQYLLIEILAGIYFIMFNGLFLESMESVKMAHERAAYELSPQLMLVTNSLLNSATASRDELDAGIASFSGAAPFSESTTNPTRAQAVTSSSFKIHKLPDDIEVINESLNESDLNDNVILSPNDIYLVYNSSPTTNNSDSQKLSKSGKKSKLKSSLKEEEKKFGKDILSHSNSVTKASNFGDANKIVFHSMRAGDVKHSKALHSNSVVDDTALERRKNKISIITEF